MLPVVSVQNVSMMFRLSRNREYRVKEYLLMSFGAGWLMRNSGPCGMFPSSWSGGNPGTYRGQWVGKVHSAKAHCGHHAPYRGESAGAGLHSAVN